MRLIDADELINQGYEIVVDGWKYDTCNKSIDIDDIPTAYDIDKVVEELNELDVKSITRYKNGNFGNFDGVEYYIKKRKAIEIVKQGGVSDDVCEWKQTSTAVYKTSCGYKLEEYFDTNACYCKQCGKKIKVVEQWRD